MKHFITIIFSVLSLCSATAQKKNADALIERANRYDKLARECMHNHQFEKGVELFLKGAEIKKLRADKSGELYLCAAIACLDSLQDYESAAKYAEKSVGMIDAALEVSQNVTEQDDSVSYEVLMSPIVLSNALEKQKRYDEAIAALELQRKANNKARQLKVNDMDSDYGLYMDFFVDYGIMGIIDKKESYQELSDMTPVLIRKCDSLCNEVKEKDVNDALYVYHVPCATMGVKAALKLDRDDDAVKYCNDIMSYITEGQKRVQHVEMLFPFAPLGMLQVSEAYETFGKLTDALTYIDQAITWPVTTFQPLLIDKRGDLLLKLGDEGEARRCWEKVKELVPEYYVGGKPEDYPLKAKFGE